MVGILYLAVKIVFVLAGYLPSCAINHGMIPAVLTTAVGMLSMIGKFPHLIRLMLHRLMMIFPILVSIITPLYMHWIHGDGWMVGAHLSVFLIYECLAVIQVSIAVAIKYSRVNSVAA
jgi:hypothetical protein